MLLLTNSAKRPTKSQLETFAGECDAIAATSITKRVSGKDVPLTDLDCANSLGRYLHVMHAGESLTESELDTAKENWGQFQDTFQKVNVLTTEAKVTRVGKARIQYKDGVPTAEVRSLTTKRELSTAEAIERLEAKLAVLKG